MGKRASESKAKAQFPSGEMVVKDSRYSDSTTQSSTTAERWLPAKWQINT